MGLCTKGRWQPLDESDWNSSFKIVESLLVSQRKKNAIWEQYFSLQGKTSL